MHNTTAVPFADLFHSEPLFAISVCQPFAALMLSGKLETRTWTAPRGMIGKLVLLCATKRIYSPAHCRDIAGDQYDAILNDPNVMRIGTVTGCGLSIGRLADSRRMIPADAARAFVAYRPELFVHEFADVRPIIPMRISGQLGYFKISPELAARIEIQA